ncbi:MAG: acetyl-CoA carboxylase biotin carboxylase subunit [Candidatus Coatesbacteria bacterium]|nr:acetyl-CoA carboxylase biotin carboxylase subunit [Candidatus Coatesbacteria bacterium]
MKKVLIANRGEIALRIIRACMELNIPTVVVHSEADTDSLPVKLADESICIGPAPSVKSYLNMRAILSAATLSGADSIHPGYGFLAENPLFADMCEQHNFNFIGPSASAIAKMGDKSVAKSIVKESGVPVVPGSDGPVFSIQQAYEIADEIGYPVIIKAVAGGGGRGMRVVYEKEELEKNYATAQNEALSAFKDSSVYIEKYFINPKHIEIQIIADSYGNTIYLGERDCSAQRRHQKLLEECPSPVVNKELRKKMGDAAVNAAKGVGYENAGTIEFLLDKDGSFYFIEMNTRIQVEHPVTEMVTGIDLLKEQLKIAMGEKLEIKQSDIKLNGHSIECRINAEDPYRNFTPTPGPITWLHLPGGPGIRVDTHIYAGYSVPSFYDSLLAKVISFGHDRDEAIKRMERGLNEMIINGLPQGGVKTTIPLHLALLKHPVFKEGKVDTGFIGRTDILGQE